MTSSIDWHGVFVPTVSLPELVLRGTLMYLGIFVLMRLSRRVVGSISTADMLIVVVVADAAQNGMSADYHSVTEGALLVGTIFAWNWFMDWLEFRFPRLQPILEGRPLPIIRNGRINRRNMRAEMITMAELTSQLREHGVDDVRTVKRCCLEADGRLSVIAMSGETDKYPGRESNV
jgi:uncharacterized membrane protein YcaP (DUF421 family)